MTMRSCKAYRCNEQYHCAWCGLQWDVSDDDRPECRKPIDVIRQRHNLRTCRNVKHTTKR